MNNEDRLTGYELSRDWFDFCFENPDKFSPTHTAMYFYIIEHCNRLGWKEKFGLPMEVAKEAIGIKNYKTYSKMFSDLIEWGFIIVYQRSKNQHTSNIIGLVKNTKATTKALTKAMTKHLPKQVCGTVGINKLKNQLTKEQKEYIYTPFYDFEIKELEKTNSSGSLKVDYMNFIKFLYGENELKRPLNDILSIPDQLRVTDFIKIKDKAVANNLSLREILLKIDNDPKYTKGKKSLYTTLLKWVSTNFDQGNKTESESLAEYNKRVIKELKNKNVYSETA